MLATELLMHNLYGIDFRKTINTHLMDSFETAQLLEKEQIRDAFNAGDLSSEDFFIPHLTKDDESEVYYNQTYGENEKV
jgi:hypothetical protein